MRVHASANLHASACYSEPNVSSFLSIAEERNASYKRMNALLNLKCVLRIQLKTFSSYMQLNLDKVCCFNAYHQYFGAFKAAELTIVIGDTSIEW